MEALPAPVLCLDKLALTMPIPATKQREFLSDIIEDRAQYFEFHPEQVYYPSPLMGYKRSAVLERDGEICRLDFDPYRKITRRLKEWEAFSIRRRDDPFCDPDADLDGSQTVQETISYLRMEVNPSKFAGLNDLLNWIVGRYLHVAGRGQDAWRAVRPTRLDVATDYPIRIDDVGVYQMRKRVVSQWGKSGRLETLNLGKGGGNQITVYDKVAETLQRNNKHFKELKDTLTPEQFADCDARAIVASDRPVTRVESKIRTLRTTDKKPITSVSQLIDLCDPYKGLEFASMIILSDDADWKDFAVASMVQIYGLDQALKKMPRQTRIRYQKKFREQGVPLIHPSIVFQQQYRKAGKSVLPSLFS